MSLQVGENFVPPLLDAVLIDYQRNVPAAREPEVLSTMATIVNKLGGHITSEIPQIFDAVFECTLNMINKVSTPHSSIFSWPVSLRCFPNVKLLKANFIGSLTGVLNTNVVVC